MEVRYRNAVRHALDLGYAILDKGGSSLDAVEESVVALEDVPLFNAGKGSVFSHDGTHELDASIMDGLSRNAGAVAACRRVKNPVRLARKIMEETPHVMYGGDGADALAASLGLELVEPSYFDTPHRRKAWQDALKKEAGKSYGTVGAVALDRDGNLAAATSTGGMTNKQPGRIGDSPVIGAGTYADNRTCAVSCTGDGEAFLRAVSAYELSARMELLGESLKEAAHYVIFDTLENLGGKGGLIALDAKGHVALPFNTPGMYRGVYMNHSEPTIEIFADE